MCKKPRQWLNGSKQPRNDGKLGRQCRDGTAFCFYPASSMKSHGTDQLGANMPRFFLALNQ